MSIIKALKYPDIVIPQHSLNHKDKVKVRYDIILESPWDTEDNTIETLRFLAKMPAPYIPDSLTLLMDTALETWGSDILDLNGNRDAMLESLRDYIYTIDGTIDISHIIQEYFKKNGYDFEIEEEEFDEDEW